MKTQQAAALTKRIPHPITGEPVNERFIHSTKHAVIKAGYSVFKDCKITITTDGPDPAKNLENAKEFGKAGVKGKWVHKEER